MPPIVLLLGQNPYVTDDHFTSLRFIINGAGPVSGDDAERLISRTKNNFTFCQGKLYPHPVNESYIISGSTISSLHIAYGLTETSPVVFVSPAIRQDYTSLGVPIRSTVAKIVKSDGTPAGLRENGEICVKGPQVSFRFICTFVNVSKSDSIILEFYR